MNGNKPQLHKSNGDRPKLTPEQKEKITDLRLVVQQEVLNLGTELKKKGLEIQKLLWERSPDMGRIYELVDELTPIRPEIQKKNIQSWSKARSILTDEQLEKLPGLGLWAGNPGSHSERLGPLASKSKGFYR